MREDTAHAIWAAAHMAMEMLEVQGTFRPMLVVHGGGALRATICTAPFHDDETKVRNFTDMFRFGHLVGGDLFLFASDTHLRVVELRDAADYFAEDVPPREDPLSQDAVVIQVREVMGEHFTLTMVYHVLDDGTAEFEEPVVDDIEDPRAFMVGPDGETPLVTRLMSDAGPLPDCTVDQFATELSARGFLIAVVEKLT